LGLRSSSYWLVTFARTEGPSSCHATTPGTSTSSIFTLTADHPYPYLPGSKKIFYLWLSAIGLHVVAHFANAVRWVYRDFGTRLRVLLPSARYRLAVVSGCIVLGLVVGLALAGHASAYLRDYPLLR
jgi:hypothetical protein